MAGGMIALLPDLQLPYIHKRAVNSVFGWISDQSSKILEVHQQGDFYDFKAISRWVKGTPAENGKSLQRELDAGREFNEGLNKAWSGKKTRIMGNHDERIRKYLDGSAHGLAGLTALDFDCLTDAAEFGWVTERQPYRIAPKTVSVHGITVRKYSGYTAQAHLDRFDTNVIHCHTHRAGIVYRTIGANTRWAMECGHLSDPKQPGYAEYALSHDWQMGFSILYIDGNDVAPEFVRIKNDGTFQWGGRRWAP